MNMDLKKNLCRGLGNRSLPVLFSVLLFASCQDDLQTSVHTGPGIRFSVSDGAGWRATRAEGSPAEETTPRDSLLGVLPLQAADGGEGLYLHAMISDNTGNALADDERIGTRSAPVKDMETYGNFGVLAYLYTGGVGRQRHARFHVQHGGARRWRRVVARGGSQLAGRGAETPFLRLCALQHSGDRATRTA